LGRPCGFYQRTTSAPTQANRRGGERPDGAVAAAKVSSATRSNCSKLAVLPVGDLAAGYYLAPGD
jgi:hypothetical protein